jgi:hypothetical protein
MRHISDQLKVITSRLDPESHSSHLTREAWGIYYEQINKDLNNLGDKVREIEGRVRGVEDDNNRQDIAHTKISTRVAILMSTGAALVGAILSLIVAKVAGG